jgi:tRNA (adenine22-N1)-methyltransferase
VNSVNEPTIRRLSLRLNHLYQWALASGQYDDVWDLCCDHGRLGLHWHRAFLRAQQPLATRVHLVDCVPSIIEALQSRYGHCVSPHLSITCTDAAEIPLSPSGRQLIVIAGVSGGGVMKIVDRIMQRLEQISDANIDAEYEFMLSPNLNTFELRQFLQQYPLDLLAEEFVAENGQCHEHLHLRYCRNRAPLSNISASSLSVSKLSVSNISAVGERIWSPLTEEKVRYLKKMIMHYQQCVTLGGDQLAQVAVDAYRRILA